MNKYQPNAVNPLRKSPVGRQVRNFLMGLLIILLTESVLLYPYACYLTGDVRPAYLQNTAFPFLQDLLTFMGFFLTLDRMHEYMTWPTREIMQHWGISILLAAIPTIIVGILIVISSRRKGSYYGVEQGSSRPATKKDRARFKNEPGAIPLQTDLFVKPGRDDDVLDNYHKITFGSTGAGKTYFDLIPELLAHSGCYVAADVKGVLYMQSARHMKNAGYEVKVLNLKDLRYSHCFNPLSYIRNDNEVTSLVTTFILNTRKEGANIGDQFWEDSMELLLGSIVRYLLYTPDETKSFGRIVELVVGLELVRGQIADYCYYEQQMIRREQENPADTAVQLWKAFKQAPAETLQSVLISLTSRLKLWTTEGVRMLTDSDEFDLRSILADPQRKSIVYVILPPRDISFKPISAMFFQTLFNVMEDVAVNECRGKLPQMWSVLMDECYNLGKIPDFAGVLTLMRSYNVRVCPYFQSTGQVKELYDKLAETIISSCAIFNYLGVTDPDTHKDISQRLGETTIEEITPSAQSGEKENVRFIGRRLLKEEEVPLIKNTHRSIVFISGLPPFINPKVNTRRLPGADEIGIDRPDHKNFKNNSYIEQDLEPEYHRHLAAYQEFIRSRIAMQSINLAELSDDAEEPGDIHIIKRDPFDVLEEEVGYDYPVDTTEIQEVTEIPIDVSEGGEDQGDLTAKQTADEEHAAELEAAFERKYLQELKSRNL